MLVYENISKAMAKHPLGMKARKIFGSSLKKINCTKEKKKEKIFIYSNDELCIFILGGIIHNTQTCIQSYT
jgi:hypothetical protein